MAATAHPPRNGIGARLALTHVLVDAGWEGSFGRRRERKTGAAVAAAGMKRTEVQQRRIEPIVFSQQHFTI